MQEIDWHSVAKGNVEDGCIPHFYMRAVEQKAKSKLEGRPVFDDVPYVRILIPGQKNSVPDRRVKDADKARWPRQWERFQEGHSDHGGTPTEEWPYLTRSKVAELRALNIYTVESLAAIPDGQIKRLGPGGRELVQRAQQFLEGDDETIKQLREEVKLCDRNIDQLKADYVKLRELALEQGADLSEMPEPPWYKGKAKAAK